MSVLLELSMFPTDKGKSVSEYVTKIIKMIDQNDLDYQLTAMGTIVETETLEEALSVINKSYLVLEPYSERVFASVTLDIQKGKSERLVGKVKSVLDKIDNC